MHRFNKDCSFIIVVDVIINVVAVLGGGCRGSYGGFAVIIVLVAISFVADYLCLYIIYKLLEPI